MKNVICEMLPSSSTNAEGLHEPQNMDAFTGTDSTLAEQMEAMKAAVEDVMDKCGQISNDASNAAQSSANAKIDIEEAQKVCVLCLFCGWRELSCISDTEPWGGGRNYSVHEANQMNESESVILQRACIL